VAVHIIWYLAGLLTVPTLGGIWILLTSAFGKTEGTGGCVTDCKGSQHVMEIGDHFNITVWFYRMYHRLFWSSRQSHKDAVRKHWQDIYDRGGQTRVDVGVVFRDAD
jgi:hypothetical protein